MPIQIECPTCKEPYRLGEEQRGKRVRCRHCDDTFLVPDVAGDEDVPVIEPEPEDGPTEALRQGQRSRKSAAGRGDDLDQEEEEKRPAKRAKSRRGEGEGGVPLALILSLAIGIPVLLIIVFLSVLAVRWSAKDSAAPVALPKPQVPNQPVVRNDPLIPKQQGDAGFDPNAVVPNAIAQPPAPPDVPGKRNIDLIALIDPNKDVIDGRRWTVFNKALHCNDGGFVPRIEIPYQPPEEYDFIVTFSQPALRNGISLIMPNPRGGSFFWYLGGSGSNYGFFANPSKGDRIQGLIEPSKAYTTTVQVRRDGVRGLLNGKELVDYKTDFRDLICDDWRCIRSSTLLALACDDPTVFHHVRLVEITGTGKKTR